MVLITSVVGSFPLSPAARMNAFYPHSSDPFETAIKDAVEAEINAGIDIISDGQVRNDFIRLFTSKISGYEDTNVRGKVEHTGPIVSTDFEIAKKCAAGRAKVKGVLTGPNTLALSSRIAPYAPYSSPKDLKLANDIAEVLCVEARALERLGASMISIDEPFFSTGAKLDGRLELVERIAGSVRVPVALHVCGDVRGIFDLLLKMENVSVLDHEICETPQNLDVINRRKLEDHGKRLAYGVISSGNERVESIDELRMRIEKAVNLFGDSVIIKPDCGLRKLPFESASKKLALMCRAAREISNGLALRA